MAEARAKAKASLAQAKDLFKQVALKGRQLAFRKSRAEVLAEDATNNDAWGPHGSLMTEIAELCYNTENFQDVYGVLEKRMACTGKDWRRLYKAMLLLEFLVKHSSQFVVQHAMENAVPVLTELQKFQWKDEAGKDWGLNVRNRAKELSIFLDHPHRIREERLRAKATRDKFTGIESASQQGGRGPPAPGWQQAQRPAPQVRRDEGTAPPDYDSLFASQGLPSGPVGYHAEKSDLGGEEEGAAAATARRIAFLALPPGGEESSDSLPAMQQQQATSSRLVCADGADAAPAAKPAKPSLRELTDKKRAVPKRLADVRVNPAIAASFSGARTTVPPSLAGSSPVTTEDPASPAAPASPSPVAKASSEDEAEPAAFTERQPEEEQPADEEESFQVDLRAAEGPAPESASEKAAALADPEDCGTTQLGPNTFNLTASASAD